MPIKYNTEIFKKISEKIHNNKYDYSLVNYVNNHTNVNIICSIHGIFSQQPQVHMNGGNCPNCMNDKKSKLFAMDKNEFIRLSNIIHNNKYDYNLVEYINQNKKVKITCPIHGIFEQAPKSHYNNKSGCPFCGGSYKSNTIEFIEKAKKLHSDTYLYNKVDYKTSIDKIIITCPKHSDFLITPNNHLLGKGCPICKMSYGERKIKNFLDSNNIEYIRQKMFSDCKFIKPLKFDFYLPKYNTLIEFDGEQHFTKYRFEKDNSQLKLRQQKDKIKNEYSISNNIKLIRILYNDNVEEKLNYFFEIA